MFTSVRECGEMCEEDADRGIDGRCGRSVRRQTKDGSHVVKVRAGLNRRECRKRAGRTREDVVEGLVGLGRHVESRVERRKRKLVRDVCAGDK